MIYFQGNQYKHNTNRIKDDYYPTPAWCIDIFLPYIDTSGYILEPSAGDGNIVRSLLKFGVKKEQIEAWELDEERAITCSKIVRTLNVDAFLVSPNKRPNLIIGNPPYSLALEFVKLSLRTIANNGTVAMLLPLAFVTSVQRSIFHHNNPSDIFVFSNRIRFTYEGGGPLTDVAWYVWGPNRGNKWHLLRKSMLNYRLMAMCVVHRHGCFLEITSTEANYCLSAPESIQEDIARDILKNTRPAFVEEHEKCGRISLHISRYSSKSLGAKASKLLWSNKLVWLEIDGKKSTRLDTSGIHSLQI